MDPFLLAGDWHRFTDNTGNPALASGYGLLLMQAVDAYIGVEFMAWDGVHYGWIQYTGYGVAQVPVRGPNGEILGYTMIPLLGGFVDSWGWETQPGLSIIAGAIPEPSTTLLVGTGTPLLWLRNARTRKQHKSAAANRWVFSGFIAWCRSKVQCVW